MNRNLAKFLNRRLLAIGGSILLQSMLILPVSAQYNYALNYQTNIINVVSNWAGNGTYVVGSNTFLNALIINSGGVLSNGFGYIGLEMGGSNNAAIINGGIWTNRFNLYVGNYGSGNRLIVTNGGAVFNGVGYIGYENSSSNNMALVSGTGSVWSNRLDLVVGFYGFGNQLIVTNGGAVFNRYGYLGYQASSSDNVALVSGTGSVWSNEFDLHVGFDASGNQLIVSNGGAVFNAYGYIGYSLGSSNTVALVSGTGSVWSNQFDLYVGFDGSGNQLIVSSGGAVFNNYGYIGNSSSSGDNVALVSGTGSVWSNQFDLYVGLFGFGNQLIVTNGGAVFNAFGFIGYSSSNNMALVSGTGSVWGNQGNLLVGLYGSDNQLIVTNGGAVFSESGYIGYDIASSNNVVVVSGNNARWENRADLFVGYFGDTNTLYIGAGGSVIASNAYVGFDVNAADTRINVTGGNLYVTNAPGTGTLDIWHGTVTFGGGLVQVDRLVVSNGTASVFDFQAGQLITSSTLITNGAGFSVGNGLHVATMSLGEGTHEFFDGVQVTSNSQVRVVGNTATITGPVLFNQIGGVVTTSHGGLVMVGIVTNAGTFTMLHSVGTFSKAVVNSGAWIIDPTTNIFNDAFIVTESGYVSAGTDDVFIFTTNNTTAGHFLNRSTNSVAYNTADAKFLFNATSAVTQQFYAAGLNREALAPSTSPTSIVTGSWSAVTFTNFSLGTLEISNFSTVRVWDAFSGLGGEFGANDGLKAALYVDNLLLGLNSYLIVSDNVEVYFRTSNSWSSANYSLLGSGELHQFFSLDVEAVPEPSTLLLITVGSLFAYRWRYRRRRGRVGLVAGAVIHRRYSGGASNGADGAPVTCRGGGNTGASVVPRSRREERSRGGKSGLATSTRRRRRKRRVYLAL